MRVFDDGSSVLQQFGDQPTMQSIDVNVTTSTVRIEIVSTRAPIGDDPRNFAPISEVPLEGAQ